MTEENLRSRQLLMLVVSPLYFSWHFLVLIVDPAAYDPFWFRLMIMVLGPAFAVFGHFSDWGRRYIDHLYAFYTTTLTLILVYLSGKNDLNYIYTFGTFLTFFTLPVTYSVLWPLLVYYSLVLGYATFWLFPQEQLEFRYIYISVLWTSSVVSFLAYYYKSVLLERIARERHRLSETIEKLPVGTVRVEGGKIWYNRAAENMTGYQNGELQSVENWYSGPFMSNREEARIALDRAATLREPQRLTFHTKSGDERFMDLTVYREESFEVWILNDVTHALKSQSMMIHQSKMVSLGEMATGIAHEINNPLAIVSSSVQVLKRSLLKGTFEQESAMELFEQVLISVNRASKIIRNLRDFAQQGERREMSQFLVQELVRDTVSLCHEKLNEQKIHIEIMVPDELKAIGNKVQLSQVLLNILSNAAHAVQELADRWIRIEACLEEGQVAIRVTDSGTGIDDAIAPKIFQPFFTTRGIGNGTGLGLSVSHRIIEDHSSSLIYEKHAGHTSFIFKLPEARS